MRVHIFLIFLVGTLTSLMFGLNNLTLPWKTYQEIRTSIADEQYQYEYNDFGDALKQAEPTRTPRPTITPPAIPPPQNEAQSNIMILFMALAVLVVIIGLWLNRERKRH